MNSCVFSENEIEVEYRLGSINEEDDFLYRNPIAQLKEVTEGTCLLIEAERVTWVTQLQDVVEEYNTSKHTSTRYTPAYLLTGRYDDGLFSKETLEEARQKAFLHFLQKHQMNVQTMHQLNRHLLKLLYEGPFPVVSKTGHTTYQVERRGKVESFQVSQLKLEKVTNNLKRQLPTVRAVLCLLMLITTVTGEGEVIEGTTPAFLILWRMTDDIAAIGYNYHTHAAVLISPCYPLHKMMEKMKGDLSS